MSPSKFDSDEGVTEILGLLLALVVAAMVVSLSLLAYTDARDESQIATASVKAESTARHIAAELDTFQKSLENLPAESAQIHVSIPRDGENLFTIAFEGDLITVSSNQGGFGFAPNPLRASMTLCPVTPVATESLLIQYAKSPDCSAVQMVKFYG